MRGQSIISPLIPSSARYLTSISKPERRLTLRLPRRKPVNSTSGIWNLFRGLRITISGRPKVIELRIDDDMPKAAFYAVAVGKKPGVYSTWTEAEAQVKGHQGAKFKKFNSEREAVDFISSSRRPTSSSVANGSGASSTAAASRSHSPPTHATLSELPENLARMAEDGWRFTKKKPTALVVYTDGSGIGNGKKGAKAGLGVWWGDRGEAGAKNLSERVPGELQTNNRGELLSVIRALEMCPFPDLPIEVRTDSQYTISCMTTYLPNWLRNGFMTASKSFGGKGGAAKYGGGGGGGGKEKVKNADMIKHLLVLLRRRVPTAQVRFKYVPGHAGVEGNEGADLLARMGAGMPPLPDREDWLDPDDVDTTSIPPAQIEVEIDESWLMTADELDQFERGFEETKE